MKLSSFKLPRSFTEIGLYPATAWYSCWWINPIRCFNPQYLNYNFVALNTEHRGKRIVQNWRVGRLTHFII